MHSSVSGGHGDGARRDRLGWPTLAALLSITVVVWEYLLNAALNPADWNLAGVAAHMALDLALVLPVVGLALAAGLRLGRRLGMGSGEWAGLLGIAGLVSVAFLIAMAPLVATRDLAHEWMGTTYGLSLAEVQLTEVRTDLTVQEPKQLCSFAALRNPGMAGEPGQPGIPLLYRLEALASALLLQLASLLPLLLLGLYARFRAELPRVDLAPHRLFLRGRGRPLRLGGVALVAAVGLCYGNGVGESYAEDSPAPPYNACEAGGPVKEYDVHAINVEHTLNRYADYAPGFMYALEAKIPEIRAFEQTLQATRAALKSAGNVNLPGLTRVTPGLRTDPIQPLVIRANLGDCVRINFTNSVTNDGHPASLHILGLSHTVENAGGAVGNNPVTYAAPGAGITYEIPVPLDPAAERAYYFHDHGAGTSNLNPGREQYRQRQGLGLFGALVIEPEGSTYLDVETGEELDTVTGSAWEAIIIDPNSEDGDDDDEGGGSDGKSFREFVLMYHEIGHENHRQIKDFNDTLLPLLDSGALSGVYRPAARAINYRSEPFRRRIEVSNLINGSGTGAIKNGKSLGYASYPFGDPATPIPRSYLGEATKTRLLHGGAEVFHVHHLHGGGDRWRRNPEADKNSNYWKGLTKVPKQNLTSVQLDSQSIGPGGSYNLEHECGAGGCQQGEGEFLYHCHIGHHYVAGMWSFWRVFATEQTAETDIQGHPLFIDERVFQADNPFNNQQAPSNTPPAPGVSAGALLGVKVDFNKTIVDDALLTNPNTQIGVRAWIRQQLPPQGVRLDNNDATVWDWVFDEGPPLRVLGEPESSIMVANWESPAPGTRPEVLFNPKNARYAWPLFRTQPAARPPFTARHTGSPWLGEEMIPGRMDGVCAKNGVHPKVNVGNAVKRYYPVSAITLPLQVTPDKVDANGMLFVLNEDEAEVLAGTKPAEPLAIRSNVGDCVEVIFTNKIPDGPLNNQFNKVNIHSHFVQFDTQASDGVIAGYSYEQSVRPLQAENRTLTSAASAGATTLTVSHIDRLRTGIWLGIGLGVGTCGVDANGQPLPCTEVRKIVALPDPTTIVLDAPLTNSHAAGEAVGVEFVRYNWYPDVDFGTVFFHTHTEPKDWDHGLFGAHIVEPKGSTYHDPQTGAEVRWGTLVDVHANAAPGRQPVAQGVNGSFREFMLFLQDQSVEGQFEDGGGTINMRAEPWRLRGLGNPLEDAAHRFSSVRWGDPHTQVVRAYVGDPVVFRGMGLIERVGAIRVTGHRFHIERYTNKSDLRDTTFLGISERFDFALQGGAGGPGGFAGDYLYYNTIARDFRSGGWGLLRVHDSPESDLQPLPDRGLPSGGSGFPTLTETGAAPPSLNDGPGAACPPGSLVRNYALAIADTSIIYKDGVPGQAGVAYFLDADPTAETRTPMVVRANKNECLRIALRNLRSQRSGFSVGEMRFDPQRSYGLAIGFNFDSSVAPGQVRTYDYFADKELGLVLALNLADPESVPVGGFGGVVVEPQGSIWRRPGELTPLPGGGSGIQADIVKNGKLHREFVSLLNEQEVALGQSAMPYPAATEFTVSESYSNEPLNLRNFLVAPADVFRSDLHGDPRHLVTVMAGTPLVYRVGQPWGDTMHMPTVEGHRYPQEPEMEEGSEVLYGDVLGPGMTLDYRFLGGAGGDLQAPGDYLFLDRKQPFVQGGVWHILRVTDPLLAGAAFASDSVTVTDVETRGGKTTVRGVVGTRPAGDTFGRIGVFEAVGANGTCTGRRLGLAQVDRGSGRFTFSLPAGTAASQLCFRSPGGGVAGGPTDGLVPQRVLRVRTALAQQETERQLLLRFQAEFEDLEEQVEE